MSPNFTTPPTPDLAVLPAAAARPGVQAPGHARPATAVNSVQATQARQATRAIALQALPPRGEIVVTALLALLWLGCTAWLRPLMLPDEGRYVGVAWEMLRSDNWLTPTLDGLPYFHKPPLFYWLTAGALQLFGLHDGVARTAPLLGAWMGAVALWLFSHRWGGARMARWVLVALLVQPMYFIGGQFANLDMLVAGCITATTLLAADALLCAELGHPAGGKFRRTLAAAFFMAGVGVLAKGLIGVVIPVLVIVPWLLLRGRWRLLPLLVWWPGLLLLAAVALPWFVLMAQRHPGFLHYFFIVQHFQRFAVGGFNNVQPFWFYPAVLLAASLPWLPWLWRSVRNSPGAGTGVRPGDAPCPAAASRPALRLLMLLWLAAVLLFFSLPSSKLLGYVLPALPPLAWLMADGVRAWERTAGRAPGWASPWVVTSAALSAVLSLAVVAVAARRPASAGQAVATVLQAQRSVGEPLVMVQDYWFDVGYLARLPVPALVVDHWKTQAPDNWRRELADAARFAPARAAATLVEREALPATLCSVPVSWVMVFDADAPGYPYLAQAPVASRQRGTTLWRVDSRVPAMAAALGCGPHVGATAVGSTAAAAPAAQASSPGR